MFQWNVFETSFQRCQRSQNLQIILSYIKNKMDVMINCEEKIMIKELQRCLEWKLMTIFLMFIAKTVVLTEGFSCLVTNLTKIHTIVKQC